jgi:hypothetical protein
VIDGLDEFPWKNVARLASDSVHSASDPLLSVIIVGRSPS